MKKLILSISFLTAIATVAQAQKVKKTINTVPNSTNDAESFRSIRPKSGAAPQINLGDATQFTLANGLKVIVVENHKSPKVNYAVTLDIKPAAEGAKAGVYGLTGQLLTSGTQTLDKDAFAEKADFIGANIIGKSQGIGGNSLSSHQDEMLTLLSDALLHPAFSQKEFDFQISQMESSLESNITDPETMAGNISKVVNYGKNHPYADIITPNSIKNIKLEDVKSYYNTYFKPNVAYLTIVGDITPSKAKEMAEKYFGAWEKGSVSKTTYPEVKLPTERIVNFGVKEAAVQSVIMISSPINLQPNSPDVIKASVANEILGGSSEGLLYKNLRETHGWTYGSYSNLEQDVVIGNFLAFVKARNTVTDSSIGEIFNEINTMRTKNVSNETLQNALNYMTGKFAISLENPEFISYFAIDVDRYHLPADYYKNYLKNLNAVTAEDVKSMANKYFAYNNANIVVVGSADEADKLKQFADDKTIHYFDVYGEPVKAQETKAAAAGVTTQSILDNYFKAIGGKSALEGIKDLSMAAIMKMGGQEMRMEIKTVIPEKSKMAISVPGYGEVYSTIVNGNKGTLKQGPNVKEMTAEQIVMAKEEADIMSDLHPEKYGYTYLLKGVVPVNGSDAYQVERKDKEGKLGTYFYDVATGFLVKSIETQEADGQTVTSTKNYSDYREVKNGNGYKVPFKLLIEAGGQVQDLQLQSAEANKGLTDNDFK